MRGDVTTLPGLLQADGSGADRYLWLNTFAATGTRSADYMAEGFNPWRDGMVGAGEVTSGCDSAGFGCVGFLTPAGVELRSESGVEARVLCEYTYLV